MLYQTTEENRLKEKNILITGAGGSIGNAVAKELATQGARVILLGRKKVKLEKIYDEIVNLGYPEPFICPFDFEKLGQEGFDSLIEQLDNEMTELNGLIHCAGVLGTLTPIEHYPAQEWFSTLHVNLSAAFFLTQACLPLLKKAESASIIYTVAKDALKGKAYWAAYSASQVALVSFMQTLSNELENTDIKVHAINPGIVATKLRVKAYPAEDVAIRSKPKDIAPAYLALLNNKSNKFHGQIVDAATLNN